MVFYLKNGSTSISGTNKSGTIQHLCFYPQVASNFLFLFFYFQKKMSFIYNVLCMVWGTNCGATGTNCGLKGTNCGLKGTNCGDGDLKVCHVPYHVASCLCYAPYDPCI